MKQNDAVTGATSKNQEKQVAKNLSGKVIPNSGATALLKVMLL